VWLFVCVCVFFIHDINSDGWKWLEGKCMWQFLVGLSTASFACLRCTSVECLSLLEELSSTQPSPVIKLASSKSSSSAALETVYEQGDQSGLKVNGSSTNMSSSNNLQMLPMLSRGRRPSAAVVEADFAALRQDKVTVICIFRHR